MKRGTHLEVQAPRRITDLLFVPNSLSALTLPNSGETLLAAGGQEAELHLSLYGQGPSFGHTSTYSSREPTHRFGRQRWKTDVSLEGASINNSVLLTSLSLTGSNESSAEPRVVISNNDRTVKFFDVAIRGGKNADQRLSRAGQLTLDVPVNHCEPLPTGYSAPSDISQHPYHRMGAPCCLLGIRPTCIFIELQEVPVSHFHR